MKIITDSKTPEEEKDPDSCNIFALHKLFLKENELEKLRKRYLNGGLGYKESKEILLTEIISFISPLRKKKEFYKNNPDKVIEILKKGAIKARAQAQEKMKIIRDKIGVNI